MSNVITLKNAHLEVTVSDLGAEMQSLKAQGVNVLWHGDPEYWSGRAPVLFPIVGPAPEGVVTIGDFVSDMGSHGFARRSTFTLVDEGPDHCTHELTDTDETRAVFPFAFRLRVTHRLDGDTLVSAVDVTNTGDTIMPFGFGFHPAFAWPLPGAEGKAHTITLANKGAPLLARLVGKRLGSARLPSPFKNGALTLSPEMFEADAMIFPQDAGDGLIYCAEDGPRLEFTFENLPTLAIWSKATGAPFVCVEPWHGMHAAEGGTAELSDRPYSIALEPKAAKQFAYRVAITV